LRARLHIRAFLCLFFCFVSALGQLNVLEQHIATWGRTDYKALFDFYSPRSLALAPLPLPRAPLPQQPSGAPPTFANTIGKPLRVRLPQPLSLFAQQPDLPPLNGKPEKGWQAQCTVERSISLSFGSIDTGAAPAFQMPSRSERAAALAGQRIFLAPLAETNAESSKGMEAEFSELGASKGKLTVKDAPPPPNSPITPNATLVSPPSKVFPEPACTASAPAAAAAPDSTACALSAGDLALAELDPRAHYRFAAGRALPKPFIAAMYSMAYFTPGVLELIEALVNPRKYDQTSMPWLFRVPSQFAGCAYRNLAADLMASGALPLGLLRSGGGGGWPYVVTCGPRAVYTLRADDAVYVVAHVAWAVARGVDEGARNAAREFWEANYDDDDDDNEADDGE
jgi:hypothetical protein